MSGIVDLSVIRFAMIYLLLLVVLFIMKKAHIAQSRLLLVASIRMTVQLVIVGFVLEYIIYTKNPIFTLLFLALMIGFSIYLMLKNQKKLPRYFKWAMSLALLISGVLILIFFVVGVVKQSFFNGQYTIPLAGMIIGNSMTGINIAVKSFVESVDQERLKIQTLLNLGIEPEAILRPMANRALETALIPTLNSMLGLGIIFLPGMMTGQILSGTLPTTAIMYQIAIMIAIAASVCIAVFFALYIGLKSLYNSEKQFIPIEN